MRRLIPYLSLFIGLVFLGCSGESYTTSSNPAGDSFSQRIVPADDEQLSEQQRVRYTDDALRLSTRYMNREDSTKLVLPTNLVDTFYNGLIHIANSEHPEAAKATQTDLQVHVRDPGDPRCIGTAVDTSASWYKQWQQGHIETSNEELNTLTDQFNLEIIEASDEESTYGQITVALVTDREVNGYAVGDRLQEFEQILSARPEVDFPVERSGIRVLFFKNFLRYTFEYGFGDCPSGCTNNHQWVFSVYRDGEVEFVKEEGAPLPSS